MSSSALTQEAVYVYEKPVRFWHWINALALVVLAVTGYLIGNPPVVTGGEASEHFLFGYIRFIHFSAGYILAIGIVGRVYWAFVGNQYARMLFLPEVFRRTYWQGVWHEIRWYLFLESEARKHVGHNPLAGVAIFMFFVLGSLFMIVTGFALYGEGLGSGSWADRLFGWVIPLLGGSQATHSWHHLGMWYLVVFMMLHVYISIREQFLSRQSMVTTMLTGWRTWKDNRP